ncbi:Serine hydrolase [Balamuthia mandrillaris]
MSSALLTLLLLSIFFLSSALSHSLLSDLSTSSFSPLPSSPLPPSASFSPLKEAASIRSYEALKHFIEGMMNCSASATPVPGLALSLIQKGKLQFAEGFGKRDDQGKPVQADTLFNIGSTSKAFTTTILAMLQSEGKLEWDKPIVDYIPSFRLYSPTTTQLVNAVDLTAHRVGLPRYDMVAFAEGHASSQAILSGLPFLVPAFQLRTTFQYNNLLYLLAGHLGVLLDHDDNHLVDNENDTSILWQKQVESRILEKLGMVHTTADLKEAIASGNYGMPHGVVEDVERKRKVVKAYPPMANRVLLPICPAGCLISNVVDMAKWMHFHYSGGKNLNGQSILNEQSLAYTHAPHMVLPQEKDQPSYTEPTFPVGFHCTAYSLAWVRCAYRGRTILWHNGGTLGHTTFVGFSPDDDIGITILSNVEGISTTTLLPIFLYAMDTALGFQPWLNVSNACNFPCAFFGTCPSNRSESTSSSTTVPKKQTSLSSSSSFQGEDLKEFVGTFVNPGLGNISVSLASTDNGDALAIRYGLLQGNTTQRRAGSRFEVLLQADILLEGINTTVQFGYNDNGEVDHLKVSLEPMMPPLVFTMPGRWSPSMPGFPVWQTVEGGQPKPQQQRQTLSTLRSIDIF